MSAHHAPPPPPVRVRIDDLGVVSTTIDGQGPFHFVFDTGAGITVLSDDFAKRAGITGQASSTVVSGANGSAQMQTVTLHDVRVGNAEVHDVAAAIVPLPLDLTYQGDYGTIDGILGYSFLSHFATTIDLFGKTITFTQPNQYVTPPGATSLEATFPHHCPLVTATADGHSGRFQIDTGDNGFLTITSPFAAQYDFRSQYGKRGFDMLAQGVGGSAHATEVRLKQFTIGPATIANEIASLSAATTGIFGDPDLAGNIGTRVLKRFVFTVDYQHQRVDLTPSPRVNDHDPYRPTGLEITRNADGTFRIVAVLERTPAAEAGVKAGETLVSLNDDDVAHLTSTQTTARLAADTVTLVLKDGDQTHTVVLHPREMLPDV